MRTTRVLDLCREAEQSVTDCSEHGYAIRKLAQAIRDVVDDEPEDPRYKEAFENCCQVRDYLTKRVIQLEGYLNELNLPPPKSDPPSPT